MEAFRRNWPNPIPKSIAEIHYKGVVEEISTKKKKIFAEKFTKEFSKNMQKKFGMECSKEKLVKFPTELPNGFSKGHTR